MLLQIFYSAHERPVLRKRPIYYTDQVSRILENKRAF